MKIHYITCLFILISFSALSQNVGIGLANPLDKLHIFDGNLRIDGNNRYINFYTNTPFLTGMRFTNDGQYEGGLFYRSSGHMINLTSNTNINGLVYNFDTNTTLFGRDFTIGSEKIGVRVNTTGYGGMYMETSGESGKPFYGYATDSIGRMWHYYHGPTNTWRVYNSGDRFTVTNGGNIGIATTSPQEKLHLLGNFRLDGGSPIFQFYHQGQYKAEMHHNSTTFYLNNKMNGPIRFQTSDNTRMSILDNGNVGISTISPVSKLHVYGNEWNLSTGEGVMTLGGSAQRMAFGIAVDGLGAGTGRIYAKGTSNRLILGGGTNDVLSVMGDTKRVGIGTNDPDYTLDIAGEDLRALNIVNERSASGTKYAAKLEASSSGTGYKYGVHSTAIGTNGSSGYVFAGRFIGNGNGNTGNAYGIYSQVSSTGTGHHYGIYTTANTTDPAPGKKSWALYASGHSYFSHDVRIGSINGASGYRLSVNGKIMCEELKVQLDSAWPDYVFSKEYDLKSTDQIEAFILKNHHLPGVPSAEEVEKEGGIHVGEMNRILLEKIEELTLLVIEQNKRIKKLEEESLKKQ